MFQDRTEAGQQLAKVLMQFKDEDVVIFALPRGGIVLGVEVAKALHAPLDLLLVRKIGHPAYSEYAIGAITEHEDAVYNKQEVMNLDEEWLQMAVKDARELLQHRHKMYYGDDLTPRDPKGKVAIVVDDGIATGLTMQAALTALKHNEPKSIIVAVPVAAEDSIAGLRHLADRILVLEDPTHFQGAVGAHYATFNQVSDEEVRMLLREVNHDLLQTTSPDT